MAAKRVRTPAKRSGASAKKRAATTKPAAGGEHGAKWQAAWAARQKTYAKLFGPAFPSGRLLGSDGEPVTPAAAVRLGVCVAQYAPRPDRMSWIYVTHGLSQANLGGSGRPPHLELGILSRQRDGKGAARVLMQAVQYMNETRRPIAPGMVLSGSEIPDLNVGPLEHWLACVPDRGIPEKFAHPEGSVRFVLLMGISDAEMQHALRVNPSLADGREVLFEALRQGGVYPVTDTERLCMTRRGDFHRLWENAFRTVRERKAE